MTKIFTLISVLLFASLFSYGCNGLNSFSFPSGTLCASQSITFTNSSSGCANTYTWLWGDATNTVVFTTASQTHTYSSGGSFNVCLIRHCNADSCSDTVCHTISITDVQPLLSPYPGWVNCTGTSFLLTVDNNTTSTNGISNYTINWGDGSNNFTTTSPWTTDTHTYVNTGIYVLTFTVVGATGCTRTITYTIYNVTIPAIGISSNGNTSGCGPKTFCFILNSVYLTNDPTTTYEIDFGDGTAILSYTQQNVPDSICHTYTVTSCGHPSN